MTTSSLPNGYFTNFTTRILKVTHHTDARNRTLQVVELFLEPAYMEILKLDSPDIEIEDFLEKLARRLIMLRPGGGTDHRRAAYWFLKWWREQGIKEKEPETKYPMIAAHLGWGLDLDWSHLTNDTGFKEKRWSRTMAIILMRDCIIDYENQPQTEMDAGNFLSENQKSKKITEEHFASMAARQSIRRGGGGLLRNPPPEW